jgi:hypothetical protein
MKLASCDRAAKLYHSQDQSIRLVSYPVYAIDVNGGLGKPVKLVNDGKQSNSDRKFNFEDKWVQNNFQNIEDKTIPGKCNDVLKCVNDWKL